MKIALPTREGYVDEHFGHCEHFTIFTVDENRHIVAEETFTPPPGCGCKSNVIPTLAGMGVSVLLGGNMGEGARQILESNGIKVYRGCNGEAKSVAKSWLEGSIADSGHGCSSHKSCDQH